MDARDSGGRAEAGNALPGCDRLSEGMASGRWDRQARIDQRDMPDRTEPALANDQTESTEANEPAESTEANEPAEPMDRMEPADPTDRIDPVEPIDKMDPLEPMLRIDPVEPISRREQFPLRMGSFSQPAPKPAAIGYRTRDRCIAESVAGACQRAVVRAMTRTYW